MSKTLDTTSLSEAFIQFQLVRFLIVSILTALPFESNFLFPIEFRSKGKRFKILRKKYAT